MIDSKLRHHKKRTLRLMFRKYHQAYLFQRQVNNFTGYYKNEDNG